LLPYSSDDVEADARELNIKGLLSHLRREYQFSSSNIFLKHPAALSIRSGIVSLL
jgi:hypothetical protein